MHTQKKFEDFAFSQEADIFAKAGQLDAYLSEAEGGPVDALGHVSLSGSGPEALLEDRQGARRKVVMLGSNAYLDLGRHPRVIAASRAALEKYGYGTGAVSLYGGICDLHRELEGRIAEFTGTEAAIVFPSGYGTNIGVISALCGPGDVIINDSANHASIFDGCILSGAEVKVYPHGNIKRLEQLLERLPKNGKGRLVITDGVFSMHGDLAPLDRIVELVEKHKARLMVDDAHGLGVVGPLGQGTAAAFGVRDRVDLQVAMLSKAPGGLGGYCAGRREVIEYLRLYARTYFFSTALPAPVAAGLIEVFTLLAEEKAGLERLWRNIAYLHRRIRDMGFATNEGTSGIIPIIVGDEEKLARFHKALFTAGVYTNIVTYPAVRRKECRLRLCAMASLTGDEMDTALHHIQEQGKACGIV